MPSWSISSDSLYCSPVAQVSTWKPLSIIHHSPYTTPLHGPHLHPQQAASCPSQTTFVPLGSQKPGPSAQPRTPTWPLRLHTAPLKSVMVISLGAFTEVVNIEELTSKTSLISHCNLSELDICLYLSSFRLREINYIILKKTLFYQEAAATNSQLQVSMTTCKVFFSLYALS